MKTLKIRRQVKFPGFGAYKWKKADHKKPLSIPVRNAKALFYLDEDGFTKDDIIIFPGGTLVLEFSPPPKWFITGLTKKGSEEKYVTKLTYDLYLDALNKFEALLMSTGNVRKMMQASRTGMSEFFNRGGLLPGGVEWWIDDGPVNVFEPKITQSQARNTLFKVDQMITPTKWGRMQDASDNVDIPSGELFELYGIRSKLLWQQLRVATIEASIISESLLRQYGLLTLKKNGFSNTKVNRLRNELSFNNLLNIVLPLSLTKTDLRKVSGAIQAVDNLRRIRNDLVHGNISEKDVDQQNVAKGIDGAIKLAEFLKRHLESD